MASEFFAPEGPDPKYTPSGPAVDLAPPEATGTRRAPTLEKAQGPAEAQNLVQHLGLEEQKKLAQTLLADYDADVTDTAPRLAKLKKYTEAYAMIAQSRRGQAARNAPNVTTPVLSAPTLQIVSRLLDMCIPRSGKVCYVQPMSMSDMPIANVTEKFANSYIRYSMPEFLFGLSRTIHQFALYGDAFRRTYWDAREGRVRSDWIPVEDVVVPNVRSNDPSLRDLPRYAIVQHYNYYDLQEFQDEGWYANVDQIKAGDATDSEDSAVQQARNKVDGRAGGSDEATTAEHRQRQVIEINCKRKLPVTVAGVPGLDGKCHAYLITVDEASQTILRIALREEPDPRDEKRYQRDLMAQQQAQAAHDQAMQVWMSTADAAAVAGDVEVLPEKPEPMLPEVTPQRMREVCLLTHYQAFESEGFYGIGYGDLLYGLALASNRVLNGHLEGVNLRNSKPAVISRNVRMQRGDVFVSPGEAIEVDAPPSGLKDAIQWLDPPANDPSTVPLIELFQGMASQLAGSADTMSGQIPKSNQAAAGIQTLVEQAMTPISVLARRILASLASELEKIWRCWATFMPDEEVVDVLGDDGNPQPVAISAKMFTPTAKLMPAADPRMKQERVQDAMALHGAVMAGLQTPFLGQHPNALQMALYAFEVQFKALGDDRMVALLQPPPPPPPPAPKSQIEENAGFLRGQDSPVNPADNHQEHLALMQDFAAKGLAQNLDPKTGVPMFEAHMRGHMAAIYEQQMGVTNGGPGGLLGAGGQGPQGMAGQPGGAPVPGGAGPEAGGGPPPGPGGAAPGQLPPGGIG